ncbi:MAG TPA: hypothetical protein VEN28_08240 [Burkholderiaceae bacterium]|nr:hypothetical protein [Burkholderiaceae bacterium]
MSYFVVVPGALVPASIAQPLLARAKLPRLTRRLEHSNPAAPERLAGDGAAHLDWLWAKFGGIGAQPVSAPYAWRALNRASAIEVPSEQPLWQADPVHFAFARDHMLVTPLDGDAAVTPDESRDLASEAAAIAAGFDATLRVIDSSHWFLVFDPEWQITTVPLEAALGRSAEQVLPGGAAAARWRKLLTEIQIGWHHHPINERREAAGLRTINGVWLHGGGVWRALPQRPFDVVAADDATVRGWALASGLAPSALLGADAKAGDGKSALVYRRDLLDLATLEDWDGWVAALERCDGWIDAHIEHAFARGFSDVTLVLTGREVVRRFVLRPADRLRFWRRHLVEELFAEAEPA